MGHIRPIETVQSALRASDRGMRDVDNAQLHGVAVKTIRRGGGFTDGAASVAEA